MKNWAAQERLRAIERAVWWRGWIKRKDLVEVFGISAAQASSDLQAYQEINPGALVYQMSRKRYEGTETMRCALHTPQLEEGISLFLANNGEESPPPTLPHYPLTHAGNGVGDAESKVATLGLPVRRGKVSVERLCFLAVAGEMKFRVQYFSVNSGKASWRWLAPHAFAHDGYRWHVRAWCYEREDYRDFVIGRIKKAEWPVAYDEEFPKDNEWETIEKIVLRPNSKLEKEARRAIEMDYGIRKDGKLTLPVRQAMKRYLLSHLRPEITGEDKPMPAHFELVNE